MTTNTTAMAESPECLLTRVFLVGFPAPPLQDHLFLFSRYDGVLLDGRDATPSPLSPSEARERRERHFELKGRHTLSSPRSPFGK